ncbi:MAG TPA: DUF5117 domain-containing protein [Gemmatimonadales bacterium]
MRAMPVVLLCALVACARTSAAPVGRAPAPSPEPTQDTARAPARSTSPSGQGRQGQSQEGPRPYRDVITAQAVTDSGVFIVHRIDEKLFYEIPRGMLGREFRLVVDRRGTIRGIGYAGEQIAARVVRWDRTPTRVLLRMVSSAMRADSTLPVSRSVDLSNTAPIIKSFDIAAWSPRDSNVVVDVTTLFATDVAELNARQLNLRVRRFDPARSFIERAKSFPRNVEVSALHTFEVDSVPGAPGTGADRSLNSVTIPTNFSMVQLPERPLNPK